MTAIYRVGALPPVVFIAQLGTGGDSWQPVLEHLGGLATFIYDRPGTGNAPPRPAPNPAIPHSTFAAELAELIEQHQVPSPAVIVGHSFGSLIARAYAAAHPDRVAGMVHVDGSIPQFHLLPTAEPKLDGDGPEATEIDVVAGQVEILSAATPQVPTIVMTRTPGMWSGDEPPPHPAVEDLWLVSQRIVARDSQAPLVAADNCGHQLPRDAPGLVAHAVDVVHSAVRHGKPLRLDPLELSALQGHLDD